MRKSIRPAAALGAVIGASLMLQGCLVGAVVGTAGRSWAERPRRRAPSSARASTP